MGTCDSQYMGTCNNAQKTWVHVCAECQYTKAWVHAIMYLQGQARQTYINGNQ